MFSPSSSPLSAFKFGKSRHSLRDDSGYQSDSPVSSKSLFARQSKRSSDVAPLRKEVLRKACVESRSAPASLESYRSNIQAMPMPPTSPVVHGGDGEQVILDYPSSRAPPTRDYESYRFVCIGDTHGRTFPVPDGDVLLHTGDLSHGGRYESLMETFDWLCSLPHRWKFVIAGNHDLLLDRDFYKANYHRFPAHAADPQSPSSILALYTGREARRAGIIYLNESSTSVPISDEPGAPFIRVFGSPWTPQFGNYAFNYGPREAQEHAQMISEADIVMTHGPPAGILDLAICGRQVGCPALADKIAQVKPMIHAFGHIHEGRGARVVDWDLDCLDMSSLSINSSPGRPKKPIFTLPPSPTSPSFDSSLYSSERRRTMSTSSNATVSPTRSTFSRSSIDEREQPPSPTSSVFSHRSRGSIDSLSSISSSASSRSMASAYTAYSADFEQSQYDRWGPPSPSSRSTSSSGSEQTIFVNCATAPTGPRAMRPDGSPVPAGGSGFQPIIIDIPRHVLQRRAGSQVAVRRAASPPPLNLSMPPRRVR